MALTLTIGGVDRTSWLFQSDSGNNIAYDIASRSVGSLRVRVYDLATGISQPSLGTVVTLHDSVSGEDYTGELIDIVRTGFTDLDGGQLFDLIVEDRNALPAQVSITWTWNPGATLHDILAGVISLKLGLCGTTLHPSQATGPALTSVLAVVDVYIDELLNRLQTLTGYVWRINAANQLRALPPGSTSSGVTLSDSTPSVQGKVSRRNVRTQGYANTVIYLYGDGKKSASDSFTASGAAAPGNVEVYETTYPASSDINDPWPNVLYFNGVAVGVISWGDNRPTFAAWWDFATHTLNIDQTLAGITPGGTVIAVAYTAQFPARIVVDDPPTVASDGHPIEVIIGPDQSTTDIAVATDMASAELRRRLALTATIVTVQHRAGMAYPGETIDLSFTQHAISGTFMVTSAQVTDDVDGALVYTHECIDGAEQPETWLDAFSDAGASGSGGSVAGGGGGVSTTVLATPVDLGGHDLGAFSATGWTRVQCAKPYDADASFTGIVKVEVWAHDATVGVTVRLYDVTAGAAAGTASQRTSAVRGEVSFTVTITFGHQYVLQINATTVPGGTTDRVYCNAGRLKAA